MTEKTTRGRAIHDHDSVREKERAERASRSSQPGISQMPASEEAQLQKDLPRPGEKRREPGEEKK